MLRSAAVQSTVFERTTESSKNTGSESPRSDCSGGSWSEYQWSEARPVMVDFSQQFPPPPPPMPLEKVYEIEVQRRKGKPCCLPCRANRPHEDFEHEQATCIFAFQDKIAHFHTDCPRGIHKPYLHGVWRCVWGDRHMKDADVKKVDRELWASSWEREENNRWKYNGEPASHWQ